MLIVGVTGCLGAGKSLLAESWKDRGAVVVNADRIGHELIENETPVYRSIVQEFGEKILDREGRIDRRLLGDLVFSDPSALERLNQIVHPPLLARLRTEIQRLRDAGPGIAVIEAALIPEWGIEDWLDIVVSVTAPRRKREWWWTRKTTRTDRDFSDRDARQRTAREKAANAHYVVRNTGTIEALKAKAGDLWTRLQEHAERGSRPSRKKSL